MNTTNHIETSAVAAAHKLITKLPLHGTTFLIVAVVSLVRSTACTIEEVETRELVTVTVVQAAAIFTVPLGLLIVLSPVVPPAVFVASNVTCLESSM